MFRLTWRIGTILCLLFALSPFAWTASATPSSAAFDIMPPHPSLKERIARGEVTLPRSMTDPSFARRLGIDYSPEGASALTGTIKTLAVVVDFSDKVHTVNATFFDSLIFAAPVVGRGSVRDYYDEVSYGQVDIVAVTLPSALGWQLAPHTLAYYVHGAQCLGASPNCSDLAGDIVDAINGVVDFSQYDNNNDGTMEPILLIHAGRGAEFSGSANDIWSHSWSLKSPRSYDGVTVSDYVIQPEYWTSVNASTSDMTIGVFAHEMGHGFWNLPDLYDRDNSSAGIGDWSLMAGGSWNGPGGLGSSPAWPDAWSRIQMGFVSPTNVTSNVTGQGIPQAYDNSSTPTVFKLRTSVMGSQEFFLLENRQRVSGSYEEYLPGDGLFIWHVDEAMNTYALQNDKECKVEPHSSCPSAHYLVALEQADAARHLENNVNSGDAGDLFPGTTGNFSWCMSTHPESSSWYTSANSGIGVTNISSSGAAMTADLQISGASYPYFLYLPLVLRGLPPTPSGPTPGFWQNSGDTTDFYVTSDRTTVRQFAILVDLLGCGPYWIFRTIPDGDALISSSQFSFSGPFYASGTFDSSTTAQGTSGLSSFFGPCGSYWSGGPWSWSATWQNGSQPTSMSAYAAGSGFMEAAPGTAGDYIAIPVK